MTQIEHIGPGAVDQLGRHLERLAADSVLLVTGRASYDASGAAEKLRPMLAGRSVVRFCQFSPNPRIEDVRRGAEAFRDAAPDVVVAVGGGSAIDMAKLVNLAGSTGMDPQEALDRPDRPDPATRPLIAAPTTAGSGSEATHFAVVYVGQAKHSLARRCLLPDVALVDPLLTTSLPPRITAASGMDALSQAIESYWSVRSTAESKSFAAAAIARTLANLPNAVNAPDLPARQAMAEAANLAGKAIDVSRTTAAHAVSYPMTAFFGVPHGHAVALSLPGLLAYNAEVAEADLQDPRGLEYVRTTIAEIVRLLGASNPAEARDVLERLMGRIGLEARLGPLGIRTERDIRTILDNGFNPARVKNNPRLLTRPALLEILQAIR